MHDAVRIASIRRMPNQVPARSGRHLDGGRPDRGGRGSAGGANDRQSARHGFRQHHAVALVEGREDKDVGGSIVRIERSGTARTGDHDLRSQSCRANSASRAASVLRCGRSGRRWTGAIAVRHRARASTSVSYALRERPTHPTHAAGCPCRGRVPRDRCRLATLSSRAGLQSLRRACRQCLGW